MSEEWRTARLLAVILAADVAGYSRLMGAVEEGTVDAPKGHRRELTRSVFAAVDASARQAGIERVKRKRPDSFEACDLVLRAIRDVYPAMLEGASRRRCRCSNARGTRSPTMRSRTAYRQSHSWPGPSSEVTPHAKPL
jgi:hypothetical protein